MENLEEGEIKKSPGVATVLSFLYCGLGQIYNGQILRGILYMISYGILIGIAIAYLSASLIPAFFIFLILCFILWITGMVNANKAAKRINIRLDYFRRKGELKTKETNLCLDC